MAHFIRTNDPTLDGLEVYSELNENQVKHIYEPDLGLFIAESAKVAGRALDAGYEPVSMLLEQKQLEGEAAELAGRCSEMDIPIWLADPGLITTVAGYKMTRGVLCAMRRKPLLPLGEVIKEAKRVCVLERVGNPTNIGSVFRSAAALGIDAVLLTAGCSDPLYRRAARVSMGTVFQVPWTFWDGTTPELLAELKAAGFTCAAMALREDSMSVDDPAFTEAARLAIVIGNEGAGLEDATIAACGYTAMIPMSHGVDSLNAAAASAVAFWAMRPQISKG